MSLLGSLVGELLGELLGAPEGLGGGVVSLRGLRVTRFGDDVAYLEQDIEVDYVIERRNAAGTFEAVDGITTLQKWFSLATDGASAIAGTTVPIEATGVAGRYRALQDRTPTTTALRPYLNRAIYEVLDDGTDVRRVRQIVVRNPQRM